MKLKHLACVVAMAANTQVSAFTQLGGSGVMPIGHEWLTRTSALELLSQDTKVEDANDPRLSWGQGLAKSTELNIAQTEVAKILANRRNDNTYYSEYDAIFAAIVGERWVDIAGFNVTNASIDPTGPNCFNAVAQEPADLQQDHFMRRYDDVGGEGGVDAAKRGQARFIDHFVNAAMAQSKQIKVWDGGGYASAVTVDHNYFLFGRAVHLFQDSFSPEHTVRLPEDNYETVWQVKAYLCSEGAEQHTHATGDAISYESGDVIWHPGTRTDGSWEGYRPSNMKPVALVALEASKDLWAAFIRTMATPVEQRESYARAQAQMLVNAWLSFDETAMRQWYDDESRRDHTYVLAPGESGKGKSLEQCMAELNVGTVSQLERVAQLDEERRQCLYNVEAVEGYEDLNDPLMDMPYNWKWKSPFWKTAPDGWTAPDLPADAGQAMILKSAETGLAVSSESGLENNARLKASGTHPLAFVGVTGKDQQVYFRSRYNAELFLSYSASFSGYVKLWDSAKDSGFSLIDQGGVWNLKNTRWDQYVWLDTSSQQLHLNRYGKANNNNAKWTIEYQ